MPIMVNMIDKQAIRYSLISLLLVTGFFVYQHQLKAYRFNGLSMGTSYHVQVTVTPQQYTDLNLESDIKQTIAMVDDVMSTYKESSELSRFNRAVVGEWFTVSPELAVTMQLSKTIYHLTEGSFEPTVGPLVNLWGFGPGVNWMQDVVPSNAEIEQAKQQIGMSNIDVRVTPPALYKSKPVQIDLSAIAKGYAVDLVAEHLQAVGVEGYLVEIGGETRSLGIKANGQPWRIAVESPIEQLHQVHKVVNPQGKAMATSGDYRNYFEVDGKRYSHTINPVSGYPIAHNLASVTVLHDSAAEADALATAMMVMGPDKAYNFAVAQQLPVLLIIKQNETFIERQTPMFDSYQIILSDS